MRDAFGPPAPGRRRAAAWLLGTCACVVGFWLWSVVGTDRPPQYFSDLRRYYLPLYEGTAAWISRGRLPLWNPYQLTGAPWLATLQAGAFYPPHAVYLVLSPNLGVAVTNLLHLGLASLGAALLALRLGLAGPAVLAAGLLFALRGPLPEWVQYPSALEAAAWLPLAVLGAFEAGGARPRRGAALLAFAVGMSFLAGYPQATVYLLYTSALVFALRVATVAAREGRREAGVRIVWVGVGYALGTGLAAHQLWPAYALTLESVRTAAVLPDAKVLPLAAERLWSLEGSLVGAGGSDVGLAPLLWAPLALAVRRHRTLVLGLAALALGSYVAAQGVHPAVRAVETALPALGWFRYPERWLLVTQLCLSLLAAFGLHALLTGTAPFADPRGRARPLVLAGASAAIALGASLAAARAGLPAWSALAAVAALAALALLRPRSRAPALATIVALRVADVLLPPGHVRRMPYLDEPAGGKTMAVVAEALAGPTGEGRLAWLVAPPAVATKLGALEGLRMLEDYEPMTLRRHAEYFHYLHAERLDRPGMHDWFVGRGLPFARLESRTSPASHHGLWRRRRLLDLASVTLVAWPRSARLPEATRPFLRYGGLRPVEIEGGVFAAAENPHAVPRAFVTYRALPAPPTEELLREISRADFDPLAASYVEAAEGLAGTGAPARGRPARIVRDGARLVEIEADLEAPGLVVLGDTFASGWRARVDGEPAPILATNHLYRGVRVPAGRHRVRFDYRPVSFVAGAAVAACAALGWIALWRAGR